MIRPDPVPGQLCNIHGLKKTDMFGFHPHWWMGSQSCGCSAPHRARQDHGVKSPPGRNLLFLPSILMLHPQPSLAKSWFFGILAVPPHGLEGVDEASRGAQRAGPVPVRSRQGWRQTAAWPLSAPNPGWNNPAATPTVPMPVRQRGPRQPHVSSRRLIPVVHGK